LRLLCERWVSRSIEDRDESIHEFASRRIGPEAASILVDAMVTGIHAGDAALLSVAASFPRMVELERQYGGLFRGMSALSRARKKETMQSRGDSKSPRAGSPTGPGGTPRSLKRGMGQLIETLADHPRITLVRGVRVSRIERQPDKAWTVSATQTEKWPADSVVLACPSPVQAELLESIDPELAGRLREIPYNSVTVVAMGFRSSDIPTPLEGFGYLVPQRTRHDVLGVLWNSAIFEDRAPPGMVLLQAMCGGWNRPDIVSWDDDRLVRAVLGELRLTLRLGGEPVFVRIIRWPQAIPQYHVGHLSRVAAIESARKRHPGLYLTGNAFRGIGVNDCTEESLRCANELFADLQNRARPNLEIASRSR
jgi:oxygen-dependent protoporphyrinogen oxidase